MRDEFARQRMAKQIMLDIEAKHQAHVRCVIGSISAAVIFVLYTLLVIFTSINIYCITAVMCAAYVVIVICLLYFNAPYSYEYRPTPRVRERRR